MRFKFRADMLQVNRFDVVNENDAVRVAHAHASHLVSHAVNFNRLGDDFFRIEAVNRNFIRLKNRFAHVDGYQVVFHADG